MPPSSSPAQSSRDAGYTSTSPAAEIFYTDEDVEVLHQIVVRAEQLLPTLPERERLPTGALFSAYDEILPTFGVDADHDSRYARLLFKIGGLRGQGNLMDKFQEVLQKQGINLEFDVVETQGSDEELDELRRNSAAKQSAISEPVQTEKERPKSRGRRNSESSAWDLDNDSSEQRTRRRSFSSAEDIAPALRNGIYNTSGLRPAVLQPQSQPPTEKQNGEDPQDDIRTWLKSRSAQSHRERDESVSTHHSIRIHRREPHQSHRDQGTATSRSVAATDEYQATSEETIPTSSLNHRTTIDMKGLPSDPNVPQGSSGLMQMKAALIYNRHLGFFLRHQIRIWRDKAVQQRENNFHLNLVAEHRDKRILLSAALDSWHRRLQQFQRIAETEKFFAHLERRAGRARDLFLLHKAFTHWAQCAIDEIERTSIARRHIVRTRIFNAWREITAVNELKVRRHVLKRLFSVWKRQHNAIVQKNQVAVQTYESNIVERVYWDWFFKWCSINAAVWRSQRTKRRILLLWANVAQDMKDQRDVGAEERRLWLAWNAWRFWKARTEEHARQDVEAETFHRIGICRNALKKWRRETQVIPAKSTVQTDVSSRLLRETFAIWLLRARRERQAAATDRMKIMREAWVNWRHKLRSQVLRAHVDNRVILQALYKWVLAERLVLVKRLSNQRLLRRAMQNLEQGWVVAREKRWDQEDMAQTFAVQRTQSRALHCWHTRAWSRDELEEVAANFYAPRLLRGVLSQWSEQAQHIQKLQRWARDAKFYFLASKTLKIWKASTEINRREKRRNAYAQVRRIHKMNLASRMLQNWRSLAQKVVDMESQALNMVSNKTVIIGMNIFDRWRARAEEVAEMEAICQEKVLRKTLIAWRDRTVNLRAMGSAALVSFHERQQDRAIKKWNLRTLQLGAQSNYALDIRERNAKKNFRKIFSYWQQKTEQKRPIKKRADLGTTERAEAWSDFGEEVDMDELTRGFDDVNASLIPGYLSTPSKRTERVMAAAARLSSTTPRAPLSTPFERHLRAQYSGNAIPSSRRGAGKSRLGMGGGFDDIPEG